MFTSYYLLKSGCSVTILDRGTKSLASRYNSGLIVPSEGVTPPISGWKMIKALSGFSHPITISASQVFQNPLFFYEALKIGLGSADKLITDLARKSLVLFGDFCKAESIEADIARGVLYIFEDYRDAVVHAEKFRVEVIDSEYLEQWGYVGFGGAAVHEDELGINPGKLVEGLRAKLGEMGAKTLSVEAVHPTNEGNGRISIHVNGEKEQADAYLISAGSWSKELCRCLHYDIPLLPARGFVMLFDTKGSKVVERPAIFQDYGAAIAQHGGQRLRAASFYEIVGFNSEFSQDRMDWLMNLAKSHLAKRNELNLVETGCGFRPCTSDQLPIVGRVPGFTNAYIATGHARLGLTLSPITGYVVDAMINNKPLSFDVSWMSPSRFG